MKRADILSRIIELVKQKRVNGKLDEIIDKIDKIEKDRSN